MDGKKLIYRIPLFEKELRKRVSDEKDLERILKEVDKKGSVKYVEGVPEDLKVIFKTAHDIAPENHVKVQGSFQSGIHNAVSKTVNLPNSATVDDIKKIYNFAHDQGCVGITIFREGCQKGVLSGLEEEVTLVQKDVSIPPIIEKKDQAIKYKVKRQRNKDSLHFTITADLHVDDKKKKAYFIPYEMFQERIPLGDARTISFQQAGIDRSDILKGPNPDYAEMVNRLQSPTSNEQEGIGERKIKSIEHATGLVLEDYLLRNGLIEHDKITKQLYNVVRKPDLRLVEPGSDEHKKLMAQVKVPISGEAEVVMGTGGKLGEIFECENCGSEEYTFEAGCHTPKCLICGEYAHDGCG